MIQGEAPEDRVFKRFKGQAAVVELVYTPALEAGSGNGLRVRVSPAAPRKKP